MGWRAERQSFLQALQFLTRLPVPRDLPFSDEDWLRATRYYPLVGGLVGLIGAITLWLSAQVLPPAIAALVSTAVTLIVTGAFHEDGLADAADGLVGGTTPERVLEIMRDSRIGTYGALALGMVLALKVSTLSVLPPATACLLLICAHGLSRMAAVQIMSRYSYARASGAKFVAPSIAPVDYRIALTTSALLLLLLLIGLGPGATFAAVFVSAVLIFGISRFYLRKLNGYTGDCLGATQQVAELGLYLGVLAWLS